MNSSNDSKQGRTPPAKKKYKSPVVHSYGAIRAVTKNVGMTGLNDGGGKNPKTSL